ncbi:MAG: formate dehydrogenase subunit delta [Sphingomonadales bacterium]|nr:formate dehydrogenase subunit delta [Sphingomonadales bacterium]
MDIKHLTYMANQIARNFAVRGESVAAEATAQHIRDYWEPRMTAALRADPGGLDDIAKEAFRQL